MIIHHILLNIFLSLNYSNLLILLINMDLNIVCIKNCLNDDFLETLEKQLGFKNIQTYFPVMENYFNIYNFPDCHLNYTLNSRYQIKNIYINNDEFTGLIFDTKNKNNDMKDIFLKENPILEPLNYMMNRYRSVNNNILLPYSFKYSQKSFNKVNLKNNSCYIDTFFVYIASKLTENNHLPSFPYYYGSFCSISEVFNYDISEEYKTIRNSDWFLNNNNKLFSIDMDPDMFINDSINIDNLYKVYNFDLNPDSIENDLSTSSVENNYCLNEDNIDELPNNNYISNSTIDEHIDNDYISTNTIDEHHDNDYISTNTIDEPIDNNNINMFHTIDGQTNDIHQPPDNNSFLETDSDNESNELNIDDCFNSSDSDNDINLENTENNIYANFKDYPTQTIIMEKLDGTIEDWMIEEQYFLDQLDADTHTNQYNITSYFTCWRKRIYQHNRYRKWLSALFQTCFSLAYLQKHLSFTHNDLHCNNVMFQKTDLKYLYYNFNNTFYQIPTYGYIIKIIDFGRAIYTIKDNTYFSDVFKFNGDAGGQYTYPTSNNFKKFYSNNGTHKPNYSFDLSRLSTTIINQLYPNKSDYSIKLYKILLGWITDKYNKNVMRFDDFDLYKIISRRMKNAVPKDYLTHSVFDRFRISSNDILSTNTIYSLHI